MSLLNLLDLMGLLPSSFILHDCVEETDDTYAWPLGDGGEEEDNDSVAASSADTVPAMDDDQEAPQGHQGW